MSDDLVREKLRLYADDMAPAQLPSFGGVTARRRRRRTQRLLSATCAVLVVALVVVLAAVLGGGSSSAPTSGLSSELIGGKWSLSSITTNGTVWPAPPDNSFSLTFTASGYTGNDSCNATGGAVAYGKDTLHLGSGPMTEIGCVGDDRARMQQAFRLLIDKDLSAVVSDGTLTITAGQTVLALTRVEPAAPVDLSKALPGTAWTLVSTGVSGSDYSGTAPVPTDVHANLSFHTKDFVASDGCNTHSGSVSYTATTVVFGNEGSSLVACGADAKAVGAAYDKVLNGSVKATLVGNTLTVASAKQSLVFTKDTPSSPSSSLESRLTANTWRLDSVVDGGLTLNVSERAWTLAFTATSYSAQTHCLDSFGAATYDGGRLSMSAGGASGRCATSAVDSRVHKAYEAVFAGVVTTTFTATGLVLSGHGITLDYSAGQPVPSATASLASDAPATSIPGMKATLIASEWKLETLKTATDNWHAIEGSMATLTFTDTAYQVSDGCEGEGHSVNYDESAGSLTISRDGVSTGMACSLGAEPPKGSVPPRSYFDAFYGSLHVALSDDTLTLTRTGVVLIFSGHAVDPQPIYPTVTSDPAGKALEKTLTASTWRLESFAGHAAPSGATVVFGLHGFVANDGNSAHNGAVSYLGGRLVMRFAAATGAGSGSQASPSITALEGAYDTAFAGVVAADLSTQGLLRLSAGDVELFLSAGPAPAAPLMLALPSPAGAAAVDANTVNLEQLVTGPRWMLSGLTVKGTAVTKASTYGAYLTFAGDGFHLNDGCNEGDGPVSYSGQSITFGSHGMSAALCVPALKDNETLNPADQQTYEQQDIGFQGETYAAVVLGPKLVTTSPDRVFTYLAAGSAGAPLGKATGR